MARPARWTEKPWDKGVSEINFSSWKYYSDYINQELLDYTDYIYRGHGNSNWKLEPTIDRVIKSPTSDKRNQHLQEFKYAIMGRRGTNPPTLSDDNDWWALGQHHGLLTPLLDWTKSPFVALFFAATVAKKEKSKQMSIFALSQGGLNYRNEIIEKDEEVKKINDRKPTVKLIRPLMDENNRLLNQRGLFTRGPNNFDLESWIKKFNPVLDKKYMALIKMSIPTTDLDNCLRYLNRMNINHSTLFPDLTGASEFCNTHLTINSY